MSDWDARLFDAFDPEDQPIRCAPRRHLNDLSQDRRPDVGQHGRCSTSPAVSLLPSGRHRLSGVGHVATADTSPRTRPWQLPFNPPGSR